jgi:uncharacterized protein (TIGR02145 family)
VQGETVTRADFSQTATNTKTYTFTPKAGANVSNLRFYCVEPSDYEGQIIESLSYNTALETQTDISTQQTLTVVFKDDLNVTVAGKSNLAALKVDIYAVYNNLADGTGTNERLKLAATIQDCQCCGAKTTDGDWLNFMCHNLGADATLNPFVWSSNGNYVDDDIKGYLYQWGRKTDGHQFRSSTPIVTAINFATYSGGTYPSFHTMNSSPWDWILDGTSTTDAIKYRWGSKVNSNTSTTPKGTNDPCPEGWKVPAQSQWSSIFRGVAAPSGTPGTATANTWIWADGFKVGDALYLPAVGGRNPATGMGVQYVGSAPNYWSSTWHDETTSYGMDNGIAVVSTAYTGPRGWGFAVRCVSE